MTFLYESFYRLFNLKNISNIKSNRGVQCVEEIRSGRMYGHIYNISDQTSFIIAPSLEKAGSSPAQPQAQAREQCPHVLPHEDDADMSSYSCVHLISLRIADHRLSLADTRNSLLWRLAIGNDCHLHSCMHILIYFYVILSNTWQN